MPGEMTWKVCPFQIQVGILRWWDAGRGWVGMQGYIYVMRSTHLKGWCKVGKTTREPERRAAELSTGLPGRLEVYCECPTDNVDIAERLAHHHLRRYRKSPRDEWFEIDAVKATAILRKELGVRPQRFRSWTQWTWTNLILFIILLVLIIMAAS